jgi:hypothetical protein
MKFIRTLPEGVVDTIFEYHDPYKTNYDFLLYNLRWDQFWYRAFSDWFVKTKLDYASYTLQRYRNTHDENL